MVFTQRCGRRMFPSRLMKVRKKWRRRTETATRKRTAAAFHRTASPATFSTRRTSKTRKAWAIPSSAHRPISAPFTIWSNNRAMAKDFRTWYNTAAPPACRCTCVVPSVKRSSNKSRRSYSMAAYISSRVRTLALSAASVSDSSRTSRSICVSTRMRNPMVVCTVVGISGRGRSSTNICASTQARNRINASSAVRTSDRKLF